MHRRTFLALGAKAAVIAAALLPGPGAFAQGAEQTEIAIKLIAMVNEARAQGRRCGGTPYPPAAPVRWNEVLARAARSHSEDMAGTGNFSHTSRDGTSPEVRVERAGYDYGATAENIAAGQPTPEAAMAAWINSTGHCANLMSADYTEMGAALAGNRRGPVGTYWTMVFAAPIRSTPRPGKGRR